MDFYTVYVIKISTLKDYNVFAYALLICFVASFCLLNSMWEKSNKNKKNIYCILFAIMTAMYSSIVYLSASRRGIILLLVISLGIAIMILSGTALKEKGRKLYFLKRAGVLSLTIIICIIMSFGAISNFKQISSSEYTKRVESANARIENKNQDKVDNPDKVDDPDKVDNPNKVATDMQVQDVGNDTESRLETVFEGKALDTRLALWHIAVNWIESYSPTELVFGKGLSQSYDVYERDDPKNEDISKDRIFPPKSLHPHNLFLTDLLQGGIVKVILSGAIILTVFIYAVIIFKKKKFIGSILFMLGFMELAELFLSAPYGIFGSKTIWLFLIFVFLAKEYVTCNENASDIR